MAIYNEAEQPTEAAVDPRQSFFASFPEYFSQMRDALHELGRTTDSAQQSKILGDMAELIGAYKVEANIWQLRPIMQVSTVLELLLQRLADKPKDISPSALRTIAGALDLLGDLAVPDLRADLLMMPPLKILAVDDEPLCLRALTFALTKANLTPDLAHDGLEAVSLAKANAYDVVFMDINMPVMDGFTACTQIRETTLNTNTPVVFVTVQSDFQTRAKSNLIGGRDFMAKPFLIFELTVKAITYAARKRLKPIASNPRPQVIHNLLGTTPALDAPKPPATANVAEKTMEAVATF
jgi:CheY-like chemotaxis protein